MRSKFTTNSGTGLYNEDYFFTVEKEGYKIAVLLDGATSLDKTLISKELSNAIWLNKKIEEAFNEYYKEICDNTEEGLQLVFQYIEEKFNELGMEYNEEIEPSSGMLLVIERENSVDVATLGDLTGIVRYVGGGLSVIETDELKALDQNAIREMVNLAKERNITVADARPLINDILLSNRKKKNTDDGYGVIGIKPAKLKYLKITSFSHKENIHEILLMTDGFTDYYQTLNLAEDINEFLSDLDENGEDSLLEAIRARESADCDMNKYPRFKKSDDATFVRLHISPYTIATE